MLNVNICSKVRISVLHSIYHCKLNSLGSLTLIYISYSESKYICSIRYKIMQVITCSTLMSSFSLDVRAIVIFQQSSLGPTFEKATLGPLESVILKCLVNVA